MSFWKILKFQVDDIYLIKIHYEKCFFIKIKFVQYCWPPWYYPPTWQWFLSFSTDPSAWNGIKTRNQYFKQYKKIIKMIKIAFSLRIYALKRKMKGIKHNMVENMGIITSHDTSWRQFIKGCKRLVKIVYTYKQRKNYLVLARLLRKMHTLGITNFKLTNLE